MQSNGDIEDVDVNMDVEEGMSIEHWIKNAEDHSPESTFIYLYTYMLPCP